MQVSRRDFSFGAAASASSFLGSSGGAGGGIALAAAAATVIEPPPAWCGRPMRRAQLTLVEDDPGKVDLGFWLDYFKRTHSDAACLSAGGCVAYYPTKIPLHYKNKFLGGSDPFGELVAGCRKLGMVVIARTDPHAVHQDVYEAHPDWTAIDAQGAKRRHWAAKELWVTCALTVHLVNLTNSMMMKGPVREFIRVGPLEVKVRIPAGRRVKKVRFLVDTASAMAAPREADGFLHVTVPAVSDHEVIAVDLES